MTKSKYEKYIVRKAKIPDDLSPYLESGVIPSRFPLGEHSPLPGPLKESRAMVEFSWITQDRAMGHDTGRGPHRHNFGEIFLFLGNNPEDLNDLGAEVEFWLGEGKESDKLVFNTTSLVFVPEGLIHMPIFFKNVKRPLLRMTIGVNIGEMKVDRYPPRKL